MGRCDLETNKKYFTHIAHVQCLGLENKCWKESSDTLEVIRKNNASKTRECDANSEVGNGVPRTIERYVQDRIIHARLGC